MWLHLCSTEDVSMSECRDCLVLSHHNVRQYTGSHHANREKHIRHLTLTGRKIKRVAKHSFADLPHLKHLNLSHNLISHIDRTAFDNLSNLRQLSLSHNQLGSLEKQLFEPLINLEILLLDHNYLEDINEVFLVLGNLKYISLVHNNVKWFDVAFFPKSVESINLGKNMIEEIGNYFKLLEGFSLRSLDLSYNRIFSLEARIFVESLEEINLEGNKISSIAAGTFVDLPNLKRVNLQENKLKTVARNSLQLFKTVGMSNVFQLSNNPLLCDCTLQWTLTGDSVADISRVTCQHHDQTTSHVSLATRDTFLCHYETHCFSLCRCCTFLACDCRMNCPDMCTCLHDESWNVNIIQCGDKNLTRVPREIPMDATAVYLDRNKMSHLGPEIFLGRSKVTTLFLNNSNINGLSNGTFLGLSALKELYLDHNEIEIIETGHFAGLNELEKLRLDHNKIHWISEAILGILSKLRVLTLHDNQVTCKNDDDQDQKLVSFVSSCRNLDVLPVSAQKASSPVLVIVVSVAVVILLIISIMITVFMIQNLVMKRPHKHPVTAYLHYSMTDDLYVRQQVGGQVTSVTSSVCYHHGDLSTQLSVGQAIASAVARSGCLVIVATPGYISSAITGTELHILADCILQKCSFFPVVVLAAQQPAHS